jgi:hypothetical protein
VPKYDESLDTKGNFVDFCEKNHCILGIFGEMKNTFCERSEINDKMIFCEVFWQKSIKLR